MEFALETLCGTSPPKPGDGMPVSSGKPRARLESSVVSARSAPNSISCPSRKPIVKEARTIRSVVVLAKSRKISLDSLPSANTSKRSLVDARSFLLLIKRILKRLPLSATYS